MLTFADDTKLVLPINSQYDQICLQKDLDLVFTWSKANNMKLNKNKFELLIHNFNSNNNSFINSLKHLPFFSDYFQYQTSENLVLSSSSSVKDLGIWVTPDLSWDLHINKLYLSATKTCAWILNIFSTRNKYVMITLFNSLVRSKLEYCSELWDPNKIKLIDKID